MKYVKYTHAAAIGYDANIAHKLDDVIAKEGIERVKALFTPVNFKWEDLNEPVALKNNKRNR